MSIYPVPQLPMEMHMVKSPSDGDSCAAFQKLGKELDRRQASQIRLISCMPVGCHLSIKLFDEIDYLKDAEQPVSSVTVVTHFLPDLASKLVTCFQIVQDYELSLLSDYELSLLNSDLPLGEQCNQPNHALPFLCNQLTQAKLVHSFNLNSCTSMLLTHNEICVCVCCGNYLLKAANRLKATLKQISHKYWKHYVNGC